MNPRRVEIVWWGWYLPSWKEWAIYNGPAFCDLILGPLEIRIWRPGA